MSTLGWENAPDETRRQVDRLVALLRTEVGDNLRGVYLHGSAADIAAAELTPQGMTALDVAHAVPSAWRALLDEGQR